jgi:iron transport multicopper oxidase
MKASNKLGSNFIGFPTVAYKMGLDSAGKPTFTQVGATAANAAGRVGIGMLRDFY